MQTTGRTLTTGHLSRLALQAMLLMLLSIAITSASGCAFIPDVRHKPQLANPFPQIRSVAVLPFINQSEEPTLSGERVALAYMHELQAIRGFEVLPLGAIRNKVVEYGKPLRSSEDFQDFAKFLGVDVVMVGAITDYQPYYPPRMTMKVSWYASNPAFHPILPGYGLPWGTKDEKKIPRWVQQEAQRALATEQLKTQLPQATPAAESGASEANNSLANSLPPILPEDRRAAGVSIDPIMPVGAEPPGVFFVDSNGEMGWTPNQLPAKWPDPRGFIPDSPRPQPPALLAQHEPIITHMTTFNGRDEDFTEQLADYFYFRDDARFGGWQAYLQRSEDFIRFCCYLHLSETLISRGGQDKSRLVIRWPIDRYSR
ncbi:MAG: hypothetical protein U0930_16970 [Pirellulales bacterium]